MPICLLTNFIPSIVNSLLSNMYFLIISASKILPFMGLGNNKSCSPPPVPQAMTTHPQHQGILYPGNHTFGLENPSGEALIMNDWPENFQSILNSPNTTTPPPPPANYGSASVHGNVHKGNIHIHMHIYSYLYYF